VPTILFGPGAMERMHQIDEHVAVDDLTPQPAATPRC
jgi:acetylornithine deacetylase/succinyl-diaminopimelate desuccinylase-like protein